MVRVLADGRLRAAGLDVLPQKPLIREEAAIFHQDAIRDAEDFKALVANHVLLRFPNVIVTPHNACNTEAAALERIIATTLANIEAFAQGTPQNVVSACLKFAREAISPSYPRSSLHAPPATGRAASAPVITWDEQAARWSGLPGAGRYAGRRPRWRSLPPHLDRSPVLAHPGLCPR